ncbi:hypothetical protein D9619_003891 [Psilocybe cf. subviscida]|uniref:Uncharacterized protein n=1 Tax=Psilocybe cf. subviscida TaxID=2480587 RepID=A0A8H5BQ88_9AGAR|nr:hypothetical protein D9619_003891 [Psilocybe cf. subviscida]
MITELARHHEKAEDRPFEEDENQYFAPTALFRLGLYPLPGSHPRRPHLAPRRQRPSTLFATPTLLSSPFALGRPRGVDSTLRRNLPMFYCVLRMRERIHWNCEEHSSLEEDLVRTFKLVMSLLQLP